MTDAQPAVRLRGVVKRFGDAIAVAGVDLDITRGEFFTMLGPSGSGKTTLLRMIAGFELPDEGLMELGGVDTTFLPERRTRCRSGSSEPSGWDSSSPR